MRRSLLFLVVLLGALLAGSASAEIRAFLCRYHPAREAAAIAEPLLSHDGTLEIQPGQNTIVIHDRPEVLQRVAGALAAWDAAPGQYRVRLRLIMASTTPPQPGKPVPRLTGLGSELVGLFNFSSYDEIDSLEVTAGDGSTMETTIGKVYRVKMGLRAMPGNATRLRLAPFELTRREGLEKGLEVNRPVLKSTVSLKVGQTGILIAASSEGAKRALIVVLSAELETAP
jgi:hypothetical protein